MYYVEIWNQMANPFPRYKLQIFAHSALSTGVEDDVIEEDTTGDKSGIIREVVCILCVKGSAEYLKGVQKKMWHAQNLKESLLKNCMS